MAEIFRSALTQADLITSATTAVTAGQFVKLGERKIEAGELMAIGYGQESGQNNAQGRIHVLLKNATVEIKGTVRLQVYSPQNRPLAILGEWRTEVLSTGAGDRTKQVPLPEHSIWMSEDKKLVLEFMSDTTDSALTKSTSTILIDITEEAV